MEAVPRGELLREEFIIPTKISHIKLAKKIGALVKENQAPALLILGSLSLLAVS